MTKEKSGHGLLRCCTRVHKHVRATESTDMRLRIRTITNTGVHGKQGSHLVSLAQRTQKGALCSSRRSSRHRRIRLMAEWLEFPSTEMLCKR